MTPKDRRSLRAVMRDYGLCHHTGYPAACVCAAIARIVDSAVDVERSKRSARGCCFTSTVTPCPRHDA